MLDYLFRESVQRCFHPFSLSILSSWLVYEGTNNVESCSSRSQRKSHSSFDGGKKKTQQNIMTKQSKQTGIPPSGFWFRSRLDRITMSIGFICFASSIILCFRSHLDPMTSSNGIIHFVSSICSVWDRVLIQRSQELDSLPPLYHLLARVSDLVSIERRQVLDSLVENSSSESSY